MPKKKKTQEAKSQSGLPIPKRLGLVVIIGLAILGYMLYQSKTWEVKLPAKPEPKVEERITATPAIEITGDTYTVKPGDALKDIARRAYGSEDAWVKIAQSNKLRNPDRIEAGWVLRIPR